MISMSLFLIGALCALLSGICTDANNFGAAVFLALVSIGVFISSDREGQK